MEVAKYFNSLTLYSPTSQMLPAAMSHVRVTLPIALSMQECIRSMADRLTTLTRERDDAVDRGLELQAQLMTMLVQRDEARVVTDAMVERASVALWHRYGDHGVEDADIRVMLTAALTQEDA